MPAVVLKQALKHKVCRGLKIKLKQEPQQRVKLLARDTSAVPPAESAAGEAGGWEGRSCRSISVSMTER